MNEAEFVTRSHLNEVVTKFLAKIDESEKSAAQRYADEVVRLRAEAEAARVIDSERFDRQMKSMRDGRRMGVAVELFARTFQSGDDLRVLAKAALRAADILLSEAES